MPTFPTPHLLGRVTYRDKNRFEPDGDTIHLRDPVLVDAAGVHRPKEGALTVTMPGKKARRIALKPATNPFYLTIRLSGLDAPEEHYRGTSFKLEGTEFKLKKGQPERSQPRWSPATEYLVQSLEHASRTLVELDRDVVDMHGRVLGYVFASDKNAKKGRFLSLELLKRGLVFPFVFESAEDYVAPFLAASAHARKAGKGVWANYNDTPLPFTDSFDVPPRFDSAEPAAQMSAKLNLPVVFRRVVDVEELSGGLTLPVALRKYDCISHKTGELVTGDKYQQIPIDERIWAPHEYQH